MWATHGKDKLNDRKHNGLKQLFQDNLVTFERHIMTRSSPGVRTKPCTCASGTFGNFSIFYLFLAWDKIQISIDFTYKFSLAPFHKNPPSFNMLLFSNGQNKNERKLKWLKYLLVAFGKHIINKLFPCVNLAMLLCFKPFWQLFPFFCFSCFQTKFKFRIFHIKSFHDALSQKSTII